MENITGIIQFILGASAALGSAYLTNQANDRRLREQLQHDRELKSREREMSLRKDIFLAATEAIHAGLTALTQLSHLEIPNDKLTEGYLSKASSMAKVHIVATEPSLKAVLLFSSEFSATFMRLSAKRLPLLAKKEEINVLKGLADGFLKEQTRLLELIRQHDLDGLNNPQKREYLQSLFEFESGRCEETSQKVNDLGGALYPQQLQFMQECMEETMRLWRLSVPVVTAARKELDLPLDESAYARLVEDAIQKQMVSLEEFRRQMPGSHGEIPPTN